LGNKNDLTVFSLNFAKHACVALGRMHLKADTTNVKVAGAMLLLTNQASSSMNAFSLTSDTATDIFNQKGTQIALSCPFTSVESLDDMLLGKCEEKSVLMQSTLKMAPAEASLL
jgi:hypothetical protein